MKIAQYSDTFLPVVDGVGRVVVSYAQTMGEMGHEVTVCAPKADMGDISGLPYSIIPYGSFHMPGKMPYQIGFPQMDPVFERRMLDVPLEIIHVHSPFMAGHAGLHLAKKRGIPVVASFHSKYYDDFAQTLKSETLARGGVKFIVDFYERCDEVWAVSEATGDTLREYGYTGNVVSMPNGTDIRVLDETVLPELRARFGLREGEAVLLYVGQLNWKKNIRRILEAAHILARRGVPFRLLMAGQGPHRDEIEQTVKELGLSGAITFTGHIKSTRELDGLYALASLFVFPSLYDNAPMVLREAAVMATPAVLVAGSTASEVVRDGVNGLTCEDTAESLADTIAHGLSNPMLLKELGQEAKKTIPVSWRNLIEQVVDRYRYLANGRK